MTTPRTAGAGRPRVWIGAALGAGAVAIAAVAWWSLQPLRDTVAGPAPMSVTVLPFTAASGTPADDALDWRKAGFFNVLLGRNDEAIVQGEKAAGMGSWYWDHLVLAAAYANKGDAAKAAAAAAEVRKLVPGYTIAVLKFRRYSDNPANLEMAERHFYPGLRNAGIPEQ